MTAMMASKILLRSLLHPPKRGEQDCLAKGMQVGAPAVAPGLVHGAAIDMGRDSPAGSIFSVTVEPRGHAARLS